MKLKFAGVSLLLFIAAGCHSVDVAIQPHEDAGELEALSRAVHEKVNAHREANGLAALQLHEGISRIARRKSAAMAQGGSFTHVGFNTVRARQINQVIAYRRIGENLAYNTNHDDPAARAVQMWLDSPGHRENVEHPDYRVTGIAAARSEKGTIYFTQLFVMPR